MVVSRHLFKRKVRQSGIKGSLDITDDRTGMNPQGKEPVNVRYEMGN